MDRRRAHTYYQLLQVDHRASTEVIRAAHRTLMSRLQHHPDLGGDPELATLINVAYSTLTNPAARAQYDRELAETTIIPTTSRPDGANHSSDHPSDGVNFLTHRGAQVRQTVRRAPLHTNLMIFSGSISGALSGQLLDLSETGARLRLREPVALGQALDLRCPKFAAHGTVAWHRPNPHTGDIEVGLRLTDFDPNTGGVFYSVHT